MLGGVEGEALKTEKTTVLVEKGNALRIPKIYRNLSLLFKPKFQKMTKTGVVLNT